MTEPRSRRLPWDEDALRLLAERIGDARIVLIYRPQTERASHYFEAVLPDQFDWLIHLDRTTALRTVDTDASGRTESDDLPDTYPSGV